jgi:hypothetical protein
MTAVEFLENELKNRYSLDNSEPLFQQAKELEKQRAKTMYTEEDLIFIEVKKLLQKKEDELRWYMEKYFSEEEMVKHSENLLRMISDNGEVAFIKMQFLKSKVLRERMYSEEELRQAFRDGQSNMHYSDNYGLDSSLTEQQWFDQFKKK